MPPVRSFGDTKEKDHSFSAALSRERDAIKLRALIGNAKEHGIRFLWLFYTFWGLQCDAGEHYPHEQRVALMVATDSDRDKIYAMVPTGTSPNEDAASDVPNLFLDGASDEQPA